MLAAVAMWARADWRRRRNALVGLILLIGLSGAIVLTAAAGARRTATSFERLAAATRAGDVLFDVSALGPEAIDAIPRLPQVEASGRVSIFYAIVDGVDEDLSLLVPRDDSVGVAVEADRVVRGRLPDPGRADEVVVNESAGRLAGIDVGDDVVIATLSPQQVDAESYFPAQGPTFELHVVGVTRGVGDLLESREGMFVTSPALWDRVNGSADVFATYLAVRLADGATAAELDDALHTIVPDVGLVSLPFDVRTKPARDTVSALAAGIAVFAVVSAAASVAMTVPVVVRHLSVTDHAALSVLGLARRWRGVALIASVLPIAIGGALLAVLAALLASPAMPIGLARQAEPDPGLSVDLPVLAAGGVAMVAIVVLTTTAAAAWSTRATPRRARRPARTSTVATLTSQAGARPVVVNGVRLALDRQPPALPVRSTIAGVTAGILGVVASLTFTSSLDRLAAEPDRWGADWDLLLNFTLTDIDAAADLLADEPLLSDVARWDAGLSTVNGGVVRAFGLVPVRGAIGFSLRSGRQPEHDDEVVIGPHTAERLGVEVGDTVELAAEPGRPVMAARVVGTALFPEINEGDFTDSVGLYGGAFAEHATVPDLFEASQLVVHLAPGASTQAVVDRVVARFPDTADINVANAPSAPGSVANLLGLRLLPRWLAVFVAVLALASVVHIAFSTKRRRQRELATLRSLGLTGRQVGVCIVWQTVTITIVGLAVGVPLGLIAGRQAWWSVADPIGVATDARLPWLGAGVLCPAALAAGAVLAALISLRPTHRTIAAALRTE